MAKKDPHWIEHANLKKGALHKALGVPQGKKIPAKKMEGSHSGRVQKMIQAAKNMHGR